MRDSLSDEGVGVRHSAAILGCDRRQVNESGQSVNLQVPGQMWWSRKATLIPTEHTFIRRPKKSQQPSSTFKRCMQIPPKSKAQFGLLSHRQVLWANLPVTRTNRALRPEDAPCFTIFRADRERNGLITEVTAQPLCVMNEKPPKYQAAWLGRDSFMSFREQLLSEAAIPRL